MIILFYLIGKSSDVGLDMIIFVEWNIPVLIVYENGAVFGLCLVISFQKSENNSLPPFPSAMHAHFKLILYNNTNYFLLQVFLQKIHILKIYENKHKKSRIFAVFLYVKKWVKSWKNSLQNTLFMLLYI